MRRELKVGLLVFAMTMMLNCFLNIPHVMTGLLLGFSICFEIIGALPDRIYQRLNVKKHSLFRSR